LFAAIEKSFDAIAFPVNRFVKGTSSTHVASLRNREPNTAATQKAADRSTTISLVADDALRPYLRSTAARAFDCTAVHQRLNGRGFVALARREHQSQRLASAFSPDMHFRTEATTAAT
jgi:hypothetical protein